MGNYEYILSLNDKMSAALKKAGVEGGRTYDGLAKGQKKLNLLSMNFLKTVGKLIVAYGGLQIGKKIFEASSYIQSARVEFGTLLKDVEKGSQMIADIQVFATKTPMAKNDLLDASRLMLSFGVAADKVIPSLSMIGDVSAGNAQKFQSLALAFGKVQSRGRLTGMELQQMILAGFNPLQIMSDKTGKSINQLTKEMSKGQITAAMLTDAFETATSEGGMFHNMMEKQSQTIAGKYSTMKDYVVDAFIKIGDKATPVIVGILNLMTWGAKNIIPAMKAIAQPFIWVFDQIKKGNPFVIGFAAALALVTATIITQTAVMGAYKIMLWTIAGIKKLWLTKQLALNAALWANPIGLIIAGIIALIAVITYVVWKTEGWGTAWKHTVKGAQLSFKAFVGAIKVYYGTMIHGLIIGVNQVMLAFLRVKQAAGIGNSEKNQAQIAAIQGRIERHKSAVTGNIRQTAADALAAAAEFKAAGSSLSWNKEKNLGDLTARLRKKVGMDAGGMGMSAGLEMDPEMEETAKTITAGGSRPTTINITLDNLVETLTVNATGIREGVDEMERLVQEAFLRVLNSANGITNA